MTATRDPSHAAAGPAPLGLTGEAYVDGRMVGPARDAGAAGAIRGLFGRDAAYMALWAVQLGIAALFTPVTTRLLGAGGFGFAASCIAVMQVLFALASLTLQTAIQRRHADGGERDARRLITFAVAVSVLVFLLADLTGDTWSRAIGLGGYPSALRYAVMWACLTAASNATLGLLRSRDQLGIFATVSLMQSVIAEGVGLGLVAFVHPTASNYILGQLLAQAAAVIIGLAATRPLPLRARDLALVRETLRYSLPLLPAALAVFVLESSDRLIVQGRLGSEPVARYAIAYNIGSIPILLLGVLNNVWMPRVFALKDPELRERVLAQSRDALYALLIPVVAGLGIGAPLLLAAWAPPSYDPGGLLIVTALVAVTALPCAAATAHTRTLMTAGRTGPVAICTAVAATLNLALNLGLVPALGIAGSALATLLSYVAYQLTLGRFAGEALRLAATRWSLRRELVLAAAVAFAAALLPSTAPWLVARGLVGAGCAVAFGAVLQGLVRPRPRASSLQAWLRSRTRMSDDQPRERRGMVTA